MKISKKSWHYRLLLKMGGSIPLTFCGYFRKVVCYMAIYGVYCLLVIIATAVSYIVCPLFGFYPNKLSFPVFPEVAIGREHNLATRKSLFNISRMSLYGYQPLFLGLMVYFVYLSHGLWLYVIALVGMGVLIFSFWFLYIVFNKVRRTESGLMIKEYVKAVKSRICPLNEYID